MDIWVHPYTVKPVQVGVNFWKVGVWVRANGVVVSWLRLQTASDCIPHPYHMYTQCFSTLMGPKSDSYSHIYEHAPAELLPVRYGDAVADRSILVPTSFLQVQESSRCSLGFCVICFYVVLRGNSKNTCWAQCI